MAVFSLFHSFSASFKSMLTIGIPKGPNVWATARVGVDDARPMIAGTGALERQGRVLDAEPSV